jgi:hypothetical protein
MKIMKRIFYITILTLVAFCNFSCKKYLEVAQDSSKIQLSSAADCQLVLDNYPIMNAGYPNEGEAAADNYYLTDANYNTLPEEDKKFYVRAADAQRVLSSPQWTGCYQVATYSNLVLEALDKLAANGQTGTIDAGIKGAALFFRAYAHYQILQLYAKPYGAATDEDLGIPFRKSSDVNEKFERLTVKQSYETILGELQNAATLLPATSSVASRPNKVAAFALLARIYLAMGNYTLAGQMANSSLQMKSSLLDYNAISATSTIPFAPRFNAEVIFQSVTTAGYGAFVGQAFVTYGNTLNPTMAKIDPDLYAQYDNNDLRKRIFFKANTGSPVTYKFTGNYEPVTNAAFFNGLATDEMYLIRAESYARAGSTTLAMNDLNTLMQKRWLVSAGYVNRIATSADDALNQILTERRKELPFRGLRWSDLRRLNLETKFQKVLTRVVADQTYTLQPNAFGYVKLIPAEVINNSSIPQNPR